MANHSLSSTGSIGVTGALSRASVNRAVIMTGTVFIYPNTVNLNSLGISGPTTIPVNRAVNMTGTVYIYPPGGYFPINTVGINATVSYQMSRALSSSASLGITGSSGMTINRAIQSLASIGINAFVTISQVYLLQTLASLGISSAAVIAVNRAARTVASIGINYTRSIAVNRSVRTTSSLGIDGTVQVTVYPSPLTKIGGMMLFEATDSGSPATLGAVVPREFQSIYLDTTRTVYPNPYNLLN